MRTFLFYINGIAGEEEWTSRKLIFEVEEVKEVDEILHLVATTEEPDDFRKLIPKKSYAIQFECPGKKVELKYYDLRAFEIDPPPRGSSKYSLRLYTTRIK